MEELEARQVPANVTVNAGQVLRAVNPQLLGINVAWWDTSLNSAQTKQMVQAAGLTMFRFPGGSSSDTYHFNTPPSYTGKGTAASFAQFIASVNGVGLATLDYGTGSPQEAAALLAYLNGSPSNSTNLGYGQEWNSSSMTWVQANWQTAGYWASLRAATPVSPDDGLNFLRIGRSAPFAFHYYEVGNEEYGSWETDEHGSGGDTGKPHDPATYVAFAKQFAAYAAQIDPTISIGEDSGSYNDNWINGVLTQDASQGFIPGFISDHCYMQAPGSESDSNLLFNTVTKPGSSLNYAVRASNYRSLLDSKLGANASKVELLATELNSVYSNPGKQSTSLVNGLFMADTLGELLTTEYNGADIWDLRNGFDTSNNNSSSLYGWRLGGDYGILGSGNSPPATGTYVPYPTYFAEQLLSTMVHNGDMVVQASSNDTNLDVFAVKQATGHLDLLLINKSSTSSLTGTFQISGFIPGTQAQLWQYGETQDTAQSQTTDGHSALATSTATLSVSGSSYYYTFPAYSMSVLDLAPAAVKLAVSAPTPETAGNSFTATVTAQDSSGHTTPGYTGTVTLTSTDTRAVLPANSQLTNGVGTFQVTLNTVGSWTVTAQDTANSSVSGTSGSIAVNPPVSIQTSTLSNWTVNQSGYGQTIQASGGTGSLIFSVPAGILPTGLTLSGGGVFSGTPSTAGSYLFTVAATDTLGASASQTYNMVINQTVALSANSLPADTVNIAYDATITASGGTGSLTLAVSNVSGAIPGLNVPTSGTGSIIISGTPTTSGTEAFTVAATDTAAAGAMQIYTIVVNPAVVITTTSLPAWTAGTAYEQTIQATGGTGTLTIGLSSASLPPGLTLTSTGVLSGTPSSPGNYTFTVTANDAVGATGMQSFTVLINPPVAIATATLPNWTASVAGYNQTFSASGGTGSLTFSTSGTLPPGLALSDQGVLTGTPTSAGGYSFTVTATDTVGASASQNDAILINAPVSLNPGVLPSGLINMAYNQALQASGGTGTVTLEVTNVSGAIAGLNVPGGGSGSLAITGTPTATGTETFTLTATDTLGSSTIIDYSITIVPATVYLSLPSSGFAGPPGGSIGGFPININQLQDQAATNHVGLASATLALSFPTGVFNFPLGTSLASADVSLGAVPLSDSVSPGGSADWNLSANAPVDGQLNITLTAKSGKAIPSNTPATGGSLVLVTFPIAASFNPGAAISEPITVATANGGFHTSILGSNGTYILKPTPPYAGSVTIAAPQLSHYQVTVAGGNSVPAGNGFLVAVQAEDQYGKPLTNYSGPPTVVASLSPASAGSNLPTAVSINSSGAGWFLASVPGAGSYTISVADSSQTYTGSTAPFTVKPGPPVKLAFAAQPASTPTGVVLPPVSVQLTDLYWNVVTSDNSNVVTLSVASGPGSFTAGSTVTATAINGVATFNNLTLAVSGTYALSAVVPGLYTGPYSSSFTVAPLQVVPGSFAGTPSGFSLQFNAPLLVNASTPMLYGAGFGAAAPPPSVIVTTDPGNLSDRAAMVTGSLLLDSSTNSLTFLATNTALRAGNGSPVLPDGTYTVILRSSALTDGFQALYRGGGYLDGLGNGTPGSGDYTQTFVVNTAAAHDDVLWVPATADGPGQPLSAPGKNQAAGGYPIYLDDQSGAVTNVQVTLNYNPSLLTVSGVSGAGFSLLSSMPGQVVLQYSGPALPTGVQTPIGFLLASVPAGTSSSPMPYKAKDLLQLTNVFLNGGAIPVATSDGLHLVAYVGDADGNGSYTSNDAVLITRVALETDTGFTAYPLVDPVIVADTDGAGFIPADAALQANEASVGVSTANLPIPPIPSDVVFQATAYHALQRISGSAGLQTKPDTFPSNRGILSSPSPESQGIWIAPDEAQDLLDDTGVARLSRPAHHLAPSASRNKK